MEEIRKALEHFRGVVEEQLARVARMKQAEEWLDFSQLKPVVIGVCGGDGIGPIISREAQRVLEFMLQEESRAGKVRFKYIEGLTIENRQKVGQAIPDDVLAEIKKCHVILKGPTETPDASSRGPNIRSANVEMRAQLDLFANIRPVKAPELNVDWTFFRENTEDLYILGNKGLRVNPDISFDFRVITRQGSERLIRLAFEFARKNGKKQVTIVTKSNVVKSGDGLFWEVAEQVHRDYPEIEMDQWFIDIMTAKLIDPQRQSQFQVMALPNLYGDILTDEAAQIQGGVGTAGSANVGKRYAMFEAIHGSGTKMVREGRENFADPCSMIRACVQLLQHIGLTEKAQKLEQALDVTTIYEKKLRITGRDTGCTTQQFGDYLMRTVRDPALENKWRSYQKK